jgi:penicillin-binding protein 2
MKRNPKEIQQSARIISRRGLILGGLQLGVIGTLGLRMRSLQLDQADEFRLLADENRINIRLLPPARGQIFDRNGLQIAENEPAYRVVIVKEDAKDVDAVIRTLSSLIELDAEDLNRALREIERVNPSLPVTLADRVSWEDLTKVAVNAPALPGIHPEVGLSRNYPLGADYAHVVGYVGPVSDFDLQRIENPDQLLRIPRFQIGKVGLESKMEDALRGAAGAKRIEVNSVGRMMRELDRREGLPGANVQVTVDSGLQNYVQARLAGQSASAVVMDCETGDLLAIASAPTFDPNLFVRGISVADYKSLTDDPYRPLASKSFQGTYPPGSTFKMITVLAALEGGFIDSEETVFCAGHMDVANRRFHCWKGGGHGNVDLARSLKESCDVYYYELAQRVGIDRIAQMARRLGLGVRHDLPLSAVAQGLAPDKAWKQRVIDEDWRIGDTVNASIGQGYVLASPLQLAVMTARLATGTSIRPRLVSSVNNIETPILGATSLGLNENNLRFVRQAMYEVSNDRRGTAYGARIVEDAFRLAGKTGTSQVRNITEAERREGVTRNEDLPWDRRDHALFVNYAPYDAPKVAVSVVVEHGGGGSAVAAPIARDITLRALTGDLPPLSAYPVKDRDRVRQEQEELVIRPISEIGEGRDRA